MRLSPLVFFASLSVAVVAEGDGPIESGCGGVATVFVTAAPVTKTVSIVNYVTAIEPKPSSSSSADVTRTSTDFITLVHVLSSPKAIPTTAIADKGPYYYTENKGTRVWLGGKSPPAGTPLVTSTTVITYQPVPLNEYVTNTEDAEPTADLRIDAVTKGSVETTAVVADVSANAVTEGSVGTTAVVADVSANAVTKGKLESISSSTIVVTEILTLLSTEGDAEPTGFPNVVSTVIRTKYETETLTRTPVAPSADAASSTAANSVKILTRSRLAGWNTTARAIVEAKGTQTGTQPARLSPQQSGVKENAATRSGTVSALTAPYNSSDATDNSIEARQLGVVISATIGGLVVTWTNNYGGPSITPTPLPTNDNIALQTDPVPTALEGYAYPIYPWNLQPIPIQVSSTSASESIVFPLTPPLTAPGLPQQASTISGEKLSSSSPSIKSLSTSVRASGSALVSAPVISSTAPSISIVATTAKSSSGKLVATTIVTSIKSLLSVSPVASTTASTVNKTDTSATIKSTTSATPSSCRGKAGFIVDFDDLPHFSTGPGAVDIPPIFNPYRKLFFEDHYGYVPPPSDPFPPISPPQLAVYRANRGINVDGSPDGSLESVGEFGAGPRGSDSAYWIDAFSVWLGCENPGPSDCIITINGYVNGSSTEAVSQTVIQPPCPGLVGCKLQFIEFDKRFRNLIGVQFLAAVDRKLTVYYIDDVSLGWSNNSCEAQKVRTSSR